MPRLGTSLRCLVAMAQVMAELDARRGYPPRDEP